MYVYGITGGISTGKSTVSSFLISLGFEVIDCDKLAHKFLSDSFCISELVKIDEMIVKDNVVDRMYLADLLFRNQSIKSKVESIIHPLVYGEIQQKIKSSTSKVIFLDIPLLYEVGWQTLCNEVILVYTNKDIQLNRLISRDSITKDYAILKINCQMCIDDKKELADIVVDNSGTIEETYEQILKKVRVDNVT